jgi:hypothetical protein
LGTLRREGCDTAATLIILSKARSNVYRPSHVNHQSALFIISRNEIRTSETISSSRKFLHSLYFKCFHLIENGTCVFPRMSLDIRDEIEIPTTKRLWRDRIAVEVIRYYCLLKWKMDGLKIQGRNETVANLESVSCKVVGEELIISFSEQRFPLVIKFKEGRTWLLIC